MDENSKAVWIPLPFWFAPAVEFPRAEDIPPEQRAEWMRPYFEADANNFLQFWFAVDPAAWPFRPALSEREQHVLRAMEEYERMPGGQRDFLRSVLTCLRWNNIRSPDIISAHVGGSLLAWFTGEKYFTCTFNSSTRSLVLSKSDITHTELRTDWPAERDEYVLWLKQRIVSFAGDEYSLWEGH